ncbi:uncharacterized protein LOC128880941 [Hylaeus volcanicus]|uniref:uncharacterized protein LOC128880941 n=1 Tax=Hylaeus volcanicus TaxID=313075 RepID=UPI0023B826B1|nr:uncharacterized protein LOC128880941 [Hylaeus volcanicus]
MQRKYVRVNKLSVQSLPLTCNYNLTMWNIVNLAILLCYFSRSVAASFCYPDYCQNTTRLAPIHGFQCVLTNVQRGGDCSNLTFESKTHEAPKDDTTKFSLRTYVFKKPLRGSIQEVKVTAFNLSITDANFHRLTTIYRSLLDENELACRRIDLYGNQTDPAPKELYVSCPFSNDSYESLPYRLDYLVTGKTYNYSKQYIFNVPVHKFIEEGISIKEYTPFVYIDVSHAPLHLLHIQSMPESYNVTKYRIRLVNNNTSSIIFSTTSERNISYDFTGHTGVFYFKVSAIHPLCGENECANSTTPFIIIQKPSHRLLIMIISTVWIPPAILCVLYLIYKFYRRGLKGRRKPNCLLVYSPTRLTHINAMIELAKYLRNSNVAVIDMVDVTDTTRKDTEDCCSSAFRSADVVLVATSPPPKQPAVSFIYRDNDNYFLRLVKENQFQKGKRYYIVQLPYCTQNDVPEETRHLKRFCLPKELPKLVKVIHKIKNSRRVTVCDKEFLDSVKLAKLEILGEDASMTKETRETENLLMSESEQISDTQNSVATVSEGGVIPQSFATNIDELNLLGETGEGGESLIYKSPSSNDCTFRVDELNL